MKTIHKKRLLNAAKALRESVAPDLFTMERFVYGDQADDGADPQNAKDFCGTPACALGHYGARRDLQRFLKIIVKEREDFGDSVGKPVKEAELVLCATGYGLFIDDPVIDEHFGISEREAWDLFGSEGCGGARTAKAAARYIERFVAKKAKS